MLSSGIFRPMTNRLDDYEPFLVGQLLYVTSGVYSDFGVTSIARVVKDFSARDFQVSRSSYYGEGFDVDYERLTREGFVEELVARELWIGE